MLSGIKLTLRGIPHTKIKPLTLCVIDSLGNDNGDEKLNVNFS